MNIDEKMMKAFSDSYSKMEKDYPGDSAKVLLALTFVGPNKGKVSQLSGVHRSTVEKFFFFLKKSKVIQNRKIHCNWYDEKEGGLSFAMDCAVAEGLVQRV